MLDSPHAPHDDFSTLFEFLPIGAYRSSPDGRQLRANPALVALNGYATEAEQLANVHDIATEWYVDPRRRTQFAQTLESDGFVRGFVSEVFRHKTRERIWINENAHKVHGHDGATLYYEGTVEDISERMRDEAALRSAQAQLQEVATQLPAVVYREHVEPDGGWLLAYCSEGVRGVYGVTPQEVIASGKGLRQFVHSLDAPRVQAELDEATRVRQPLRQEFRIQRPDGTLRWVEANSSIAATQGKRADRVGVVLDITERKQATDALRESEARWRLALDATGDGVWDVDLRSGAETFSPQFLDLYGFGPGEVPAESELFDQRTHPDDRAQMLRDREDHFAGRTARYVNEHRVRCKDGRWKWVLSRGLVIERDHDGRPVRMIGTHTDITAAKEAEALRRARDQAESADRAKTELLSRVSHELRTPMNGVLGFAQLLEKARDLPPQYRPWVAQILASGKHLAGVVDDLLDLSSAQSGGMALALSPVDTATVAQDSWAMVASRARDAGVAFVPQLDGLQGVAVLADRRRLTQVFTNLLSNAVKYNRSGGLVEMVGRRLGDTIEIDVVDSGLGMNQEQLARIFQPFQRLGAEASGVEGTGLGLALSRQLVVAMGGEIRVVSRAGLGTTFTVALCAAG